MLLSSKKRVGNNNQHENIFLKKLFDQIISDKRDYKEEYHPQTHFIKMKTY